MFFECLNACWIVCLSVLAVAAAAVGVVVLLVCKRFAVNSKTATTKKS